VINLAPVRPRAGIASAIVALPVALAISFAVWQPMSSQAAGGNKKCSEFASQKAAQKYFVGHGGSESDDVGRLDPDGDGLVCPDNPGPFAAYVELAFAKGFFYGQVVCVNYPAHWTKAEEHAEETSRKRAEEEQAKRVAVKNCTSPLIEVELREVAPGEDPVVASHKAEAGGESTLLPLGAPEAHAKGSVLSFEFKLEPKKTKGTFYAVSEECFNTPSRHVSGG
jgi:hypothetical protein